MHLVARRGRAVAADWVLINLVGAIFVFPLLSSALSDFKDVLIVYPVLIAFLMLIYPMAFQGRTPGKRWCKLALRGQGCLVCREIRRLGWLLAFGTLGLSREIHPLGPVLIWGILFVWLALGFVIPALRKQQDFPHNTATGFHIEKL